MSRISVTQHARHLHILETIGTGKLMDANNSPSDLNLKEKGSYQMGGNAWNCKIRGYPTQSNTKSQVLWDNCCRAEFNDTDYGAANADPDLGLIQPSEGYSN